MSLAKAGSISLFKLENFDNKHVYEKCQEALLQADTKNFVIHFDDKTASSALDVDELFLEDFLLTYPSKAKATRWINIFGPERQKNLVKALSDRYNFSPRLLGLMQSKHCVQSSKQPGPQQHRHFYDKVAGFQPTYTGSQSPDPEKDIDGVAAYCENPPLRLDHYTLVNEVWHYSSIDRGPKCESTAEC